MRPKVWRQNEYYLSSRHHFLITDARMPEALRKQTAEHGIDKTMHACTQGWPNQRCVLITRRMKSASAHKVKENEAAVTH